MLDVLRERGLGRVFIEGGGRTVSRFLHAGCLDILQICISPVIIGGGRPGLSLPEIATMDDALRLDGVAIPMGADILHHFQLDGPR